MPEIKKVAVINCPQCSGEMELFTREDYSFWPEGILELMMCCKKCNYKAADVMPLKMQPPCKLELKVDSANDLKIRILKSSSAKVLIPELGVEIKPGPASEGYISNVEGVLDRVEKVLIDMIKWKKRGANKILDKIRRIREGSFKPFTLIIEDPTGCSLIISGKTKKSEL